jgi:hypothetical protein
MTARLHPVPAEDLAELRRQSDVPEAFYDDPGFGGRRPGDRRRCGSGDRLPHPGLRRPAYTVGSDAEARRLVEELVAVKAVDLSSALTYLGRLDSGEVESSLAGRLGTDRAAVAGMSAGGGGAFQAARTDERFSAVVTLDGNPYDANPGPYDQPALALTNQSSTGSDDRDTFRPMTSVEGTDGVELYEFPAPRDLPQLGWLGPVALSVRTDRRCLGVSTAPTDRCS